MKLKILKSVTVITPTVGSAKLQDAVQSILNQTYEGVKHLVVSDGPEHFDSVIDNVIEAIDSRKDRKPEDYRKVITTVTPWNTGANGFNGQRIYAAYPHLVNSDYVFFLDEDNWYQDNHVETLIDLIESEGLDWAHSFRSAYSLDKKFVAEDNCESLGKWPIYFTHDNPQYLVDTSSFAFTRNFIKQTCHLWHSGPWGEDRRYFYAIKDRSKWNTTCKHTLCYRLDGNPKSVNKEFFDNGNKIQLENYKGNLPWKNT
jgi:glycosyltransferase involved in cell wall biosynthesis